MSRDKLIVGLLLVDLLALSIYAIAQEGVGGLWQHLSSMGWWGWQLTADLVIALGLGMVWLWRDARRRGVSGAGWVALTLLSGSIGLMLYLLRRPAVDSAGDSVVDAG